MVAGNAADPVAAIAPCQSCRDREGGRESASGSSDVSEATTGMGGALLPPQRRVEAGRLGSGFYRVGGVSAY